MFSWFSILVALHWCPCIWIRSLFFQSFRAGSKGKKDSHCKAQQSLRLQLYRGMWDVGCRSMWGSGYRVELTTVCGYMWEMVFSAMCPCCCDLLPLIFVWKRTHLPMQETRERQVHLLGWEDPLEKGMAIQSSIIAWRIPSTEDPGGLQSIDLQRVGHNWNDLACMHEPSDNVLTVLGARDRSQLPRQCLTNCGEARLWLHSLFLLWEKSQSRGISLSTESCWPGIKVIR